MVKRDRAMYAHPLTKTFHHPMINQLQRSWLIDKISAKKQAAMLWLRDRLQLGHSVCFLAVLLLTSTIGHIRKQAECSDHILYSLFSLGVCTTPRHYYAINNFVMPVNIIKT